MNTGILFVIIFLTIFISLVIYIFKRRKSWQNESSNGSSSSDSIDWDGLDNLSDPLDQALLSSFVKTFFFRKYTHKVAFNNLCSYVPVWFKVRNGHALHYRSFLQQKKTLNFSELLNL